MPPIYYIRTHFKLNNITIENHYQEAGILHKIRPAFSTSALICDYCLKDLVTHCSVLFFLVNYCTYLFFLKNEQPSQPCILVDQETKVSLEFYIWLFKDSGRGAECKIVREEEGQACE